MPDGSRGREPFEEVLDTLPALGGGAGAGGSDDMGNAVVCGWTAPWVNWFIDEGLCWRLADMSSCQPHCFLSSVLMKPTRQPVSCRILSKIWSTSSCSLLVARHSAAMARDRRATLATPLEVLVKLENEGKNSPILDVRHDAANELRIAH